MGCRSASSPASSVLNGLAAGGVWLAAALEPVSAAGEAIPTGPWIGVVVTEGKGDAIDMWNLKDDPCAQQSPGQVWSLIYLYDIYRIKIRPTAGQGHSPAEFAALQGPSWTKVAVKRPASYSSSMLNSLGFAKPESETRVVVAMSGGVDSSVVAALLHAQGYEVIGITLQLYDFGAALKKTGACCAGTDIADARAVATRLGIAHYVLDYESRFRDAVMEDFADTYLAGSTPIPCVRCNQRVKFADLLATARDLGADCLATGHYLQRSADGHLLRAADVNRDQSYFLFATTQSQADYLRFPLGHMLKPDVRALADSFGLIVADKPDSQDICFVPQGRYVDVVQKLRPGAAQPGEIVHVDGRVLGEHKGIIFFTVGQRKGLDIGGLAEPLYVVKLDAAKRQVVVGPKQALDVAAATLKEVNWLGAPDAAQRLMVKVRSAAPPVEAELELGPDGSAEVRFLEPLPGVAPGQACVFYAGERLLGGGWIASTRSSLADGAVLRAAALVSA